MTISAAKSYSPNTTIDGMHPLNAVTVDMILPMFLPVTTGNAGNHCAELSFRGDDDLLVTCRYGGGASVAHVAGNPTQTALGLNYVFDSCQLGAACPTASGAPVDGSPGSIVSAKNAVNLHVSNGDDQQGTTTANATLRVCVD